MFNTGKVQVQNHNVVTQIGALVSTITCLSKDTQHHTFSRDTCLGDQ